MNIEKLEVGQTFKNYKELCLELEMEIKKSGDTKKAQFNELSRYCRYSKMGHKFFIEEVYKTPLPRVENRGKSSIYGNLIQLLITDLLAQCDGHVSISRSKLMLSIGMVNINYGACRELVKKLAEYTNLEEKVVYDFYNTSSGSFKSLIESSLSSLMDKRVIMYNKIIKVSDIGQYNSRNATYDELDLIMEIEKGILEELGYKKVSDVRVSKDWVKFKTNANRLLHEKSEIDFYYTAYDIKINEKYIVEERNDLINLLLEQVKRKESKDELNQIIYSQLLTNAHNRHKKGFTSGKKTSKIRMDKNYVENMRKLADLLIDQGTRNIIYDVNKIKIESEANQLIDNIDEQLDALFS